jgi:hypothetical protein
VADAGLDAPPEDDAESPEPPHALRRTVIATVATKQRSPGDRLHHAAPAAPSRRELMLILP